MCLIPPKGLERALRRERVAGWRRARGFLYGMTASPRRPRSHASHSYRNTGRPCHCHIERSTSRVHPVVGAESAHLLDRFQPRLEAPPPGLGRAAWPGSSSPLPRPDDPACVGSTASLGLWRTALPSSAPSTPRHPGWARSLAATVAPGPEPGPGRPRPPGPALPRRADRRHGSGGAQAEPGWSRAWSPSV